MYHFNNFTSSSSSSEDEEEIVLRRPKIYRKRRDYFDIYDEQDFFDRFRLRKATAEFLLQQIEPMIQLPTNRGGCIKPAIQLLLTLRFYASGNMLITVGDFVGVSRSSASRIVKRVTTAIASLRPEYIAMYNTNAAMERAAESFYEIASFPRVIGAIDCTLVKIDSPGGHDAEIYRSRKSYFALNIQSISDSNLKFKDIVARWPGSVHDQTIFNNSSVKERFETGTFGHYMLLGDSGYSLKPYLMTKLHETHNRAEDLYNESLIRTRNVVERQYGVWKRRFPILRNGIRLNLDTIMAVIVATAVLHNIAIERNEDIPEDWLNALDDDQDNEEEIMAANIPIGARNLRQLIINEHFARL